MNVDAYCVIGIDREYDLTPEMLLRKMDEGGVDRAVIAPVDRCLAVDNREGNDAMIHAAAASEGRFIPACTANPWYGDKAVDEVRRAISKGAGMLVMHPFVQGFVADDELMWPILDTAAEIDLPVYIHTGPPGNATPWQIVDLAERYKGISFIMGHCGATDFWYDVVDACNSAANIFIESSLARPFNFAGYISRLGHGRGIMGSFAPVNDLVFEWEQMRNVLHCDEWADVYGGTILQILNRGGRKW